ncbi:MAG: hypothetical protein GY777_04085 [Candidatus Brocadiaceae bacterium]|nr:hypothetical protein [Candidatus Brocadiaceae bacterium]
MPVTGTAGAIIGCRRSSAFWGLGCPKTHHEIKDSLGAVAGESIFEIITGFLESFLEGIMEVIGGLFDAISSIFG